MVVILLFQRQKKEASTNSSANRTVRTFQLAIYQTIHQTMCVVDKVENNHISISMENKHQTKFYNCEAENNKQQTVTTFNSVGVVVSSDTIFDYIVLTAVAAVAKPPTP